MNDLVSIIMPAYRMGAFIGDALASVGAQTHSNWEVIVVDDHGPEDGTEGAVRGFAARFPQHRTELLRHECNAGVSAARNTGIAVAQGAFIALLDPDDLWLPDHLTSALKALQDGQGGDVVCGPVESFRADPGRSWTHRASFSPWMTRNFPHSLVVHNFIQPSAVVMRSVAIRQAGHFDTDPAVQHIEDLDFWIRLVQAGQRFTFRNTITVRYRKHAGAATEDAERFLLLQDALHAKHPRFFREGLRRMMRAAHEDIHRSDQRNSGPIMTSIFWLDAMFQRLRRWVRPV